jgi:hypothetical protein
MRGWSKPLIQGPTISDGVFNTISLSSHVAYRGIRRRPGNLENLRSTQYGQIEILFEAGVRIS